MKHWILLLSCLLLCACVSGPPAVPPAQVLRDDLFPDAHLTVNAKDVLAASDEMKHYVDHELTAQLRRHGLQKGLLDALYNKRQLKLEYDAERTRNAAEAFEARAGNCLSLVLMTAALAKHLGLQVSYQSVYTDETWTRNKDTYFASGHVNIVLGQRTIDQLTRGSNGPNWTIDFLPSEDVRGHYSREIDEDTVVAMYMNNRAAESLAGADLSAAYGWARAAVLQAPRFLSAYNTLGVVYLRSGHTAAAELALAHVLQQEPTSTTGLANMAHVLTAQGRVEESAALMRTLNRIDPEPPFHFFDLGQDAMHRADYVAARNWFQKEVRRAPYHHEFHFWLAVAEAQLGDVVEAKTQLSLALDTSTTRKHQALYAAKLDRLRAQGVQ